MDGETFDVVFFVDGFVLVLVATIDAAYQGPQEWFVGRDDYEGCMPDVEVVFMPFQEVFEAVGGDPAVTHGGVEAGVTYGF